MKRKEKYEIPGIEILLLDIHDVIITSEDNNETDIEGPF